MGFPKIRHQELCIGIVVLLGSLAVILLLFAMAIPLAALVGSPVVGTILSSAILCTGFFLAMDRMNPVLGDMELIFQQIRNDQKVRPEYVTDQNGTDRETITTTLLKRLNRFGYTEPVPPGEWTPICLRCKQESRDAHATPVVADMNSYVAVYSVPYLSEVSYRAILADARARCLAIHDEVASDPHSPAAKKERSRYRLVIILADTVADSVRELALERSAEAPHWQELPCVVECCSLKYYVNLREEPRGLRDMAWTDYPAWPCWRLPKKFVFGGRIPTNPVEPDWIDLDESLWSLLHRISQEQKVEFANLLPRARQLLRRMWDQEVRLEKNAVLVRSGNRLAICPCTMEGEHLTVHPAHRWVNCELGLAYRELVLLTQEEAATLEQQATACLNKYGYTVEWKN